MIREAFLALGMINASTALHASEVIHLRCELPTQPTKEVETIALNLGEGKAVRTSPSGNQTFYNVYMNGSDAIVGFGERSGRTARLNLNRVTGIGRVDEQMTNQDKPRLWNERTGSIGYPLDEEVWLGYDLNCQIAQPLF